MSTLIKIDVDIQSNPEPEGHAFGYYVFDTLLKISAVLKEEVVINMVENTFSTQVTNLDIGVSKTLKQADIGNSCTASKSYQSCA